jgi:hypothetical protein
MRRSDLLLLTLAVLIPAGIGLVPSSSTAAPDAKRRVFITDSKSWELAGGFGGSRDAFGGASGGGARPQTVEIIKTFTNRCPVVTVTIKQDKADYIVMLDHEGGKGATSRDNKIAVFNKNGDLIFSNSTRILGNAVKDACQAIEKDSGRK